MTAYLLLTFLIACSEKESFSDSQPGGSAADSGFAGDGGPSLLCRDDTETIPATLPAISTNSYGRQYRIVQIQSDDIDPLYAVVSLLDADEAPAYTEGAPVVVTAYSTAAASTYEASGWVNYVDAGWGVVEIAPIYSGHAIDGYASGGVADGFGLGAARVIRDVVRFATGQTTTVEGWTLSQVTERPVCNGAVPLQTFSVAGTPGLQALRQWPEVTSGYVLGYVAFESPGFPQFINGEGGSIYMDPADNIDSDADGYTWDDARNPTYVPGACQGSSCALDYSALQWSDDIEMADLMSALYHRQTPGMFYLDNNANGKLDVVSRDEEMTVDVNNNGSFDPDEDYPLFCNQSDPDGDRVDLMYCSMPLIEAAIANGVLDAWPEGVATEAEAGAFWEDRNLYLAIDDMVAAQPAWLRVGLAFTESDHALALPTRPHVLALHDAFYGLGVDTQYNMSREVANCFVEPGLLGDWDAVPANTLVNEENLAAHAFPDHLNYLSATLISLEFYATMVKPLDRCPAMED